MKSVHRRMLLKIVVLLAIVALNVRSALAQCTISPPGPFTVLVGELVTFTVTVDPSLLLFVPPLPTGAVFVGGTFSWTPATGQEGNLTLDFITFDISTSLEDTCSVSITVNPGPVSNLPPVADAGDDQTVECTSPSGTPVTLDGTGSSDPDGDPLTHTWTAPLSFSGTVSGPTPTVTLLLGLNTITLTVDDGNGGTDTDEVTINVVDTSPPTITLSGANPMTVECAGTYVEPGATASDGCGGDLTSSIVITGSINTAVPGSYAVTYSVTDPSGNSGSATRTVNIVDSTPPTITLNGDNPMTLVSPDPYVEPGAVTTDLCDPSPDLVISGVVNSLVPGTYIITYTATDASGNSSSVDRTVNVVAPPDFCSLLSPIVTAVMDLADDTSIPKKVHRHIKGAAKHLEKALDTCSGTGEDDDDEDEDGEDDDDEDDEQDRKTERTFRQVEHGIAELERAIKRSEDSALDDMLQGFIDDLVALIQAETETIVAEALAVAGPDNKHVKKALKHLARGLQKLSEGKIHRAIDEFIKAVRQATKALEGEESPDPLAEGNAVSSQGSGASATPLSYRLLQNYPNPFNPTTMISYELADKSLVRLKVYDILGRELADLVHETQMPGTYQVAFDAQDLPSGVYFYRLEVYNPETGEGRYLASQKMVLTK